MTTFEEKSNNEQQMRYCPPLKNSCKINCAFFDRALNYHEQKASCLVKDLLKAFLTGISYYIGH